MAFATDELDLSYVTCTANCETASPTWQQQFIETSDDLDASYPIAHDPELRLHQPGWSSVILRWPWTRRDNPNVSYYVKHGQLCYDSPGHLPNLFNAKSIRFATAGGTAQNNRRVYLPMVIR